MVGLDTVTVAADRLNPPYSFEEDGELRGTSVELIARAFAARGVDVRFAPVDGPVAQAIAVAAGRADATADFSITGRRRRWYSFSRHYGVEELQVFTMREGPLWSGLLHFHGALGVKAESHAQEYFIRHYRGMPLFLAETTGQLVQALRRGRVQAIVLPRAGGAALFEGRSEGGEAGAEDVDVLARGAPFGATLLALAALPDHEDVLDEFNAGLAALAH